MKTAKRYICLLVAMTLMLSTFAFIVYPVNAASYDNTYTNTGNHRADIIGVAKTQLGYTEGSSGYTKYGDWWGLPNADWCAIFVSWCARQAGIPQDVLKSASLASPSSDAYCFNIPCYSGSSYTPQSGDLFFTKSRSHVGLVYYTEGSYFYTIEGNASNMVKTNKYLISNYDFGVPNYNSPPDDEITCNCSTSYAGTYICTTTTYTLTIRSGHGTSYSAIGSIPPGATVTVTKANGTGSSAWAHVTYNGVSGYASMEYLSKKQTTQERNNKMRLWLSDSKMGDSISSIRTGEWLYLCYELYDANSGDLLDSYNTSGGYTVKLTLYETDGSVAHTYTYSNDNNWISIKRTTPGAYKGELVFTWNSGGSATVTRSINMVYEPRVTPSDSDIQLDLTGTSSQTISISYSGTTNSSSIYLDCTTSGNCFSYKWGSWGDHKMPLTITGVRAGSGTITIEMYDSDTDALLATAKVYVTVAAPTYSVTYNANGGSGAPSSQTKYHNTALTLSNTKPTRTGYTFLGWYTSSSATSASYQPGGSFSTNANTTLYAVWQANKYIISYNANGGSGAPSSQTKTYGTALTLSSTKPTRTGYTFLGWSTSSSATSASYQPGGSFSTNANTTLYAVWQANKYTVSYNANGGSGAPSSRTKTHGTALMLSSTKPTRTGYTFLGWSTSSSATSASYQPGGSFSANANTTLYAVWQAVNKYTISYNANGGSGAPSSQTTTAGESVTLSSTKPIREGYTFLGWSTNPTAASAYYQPGESFGTNTNVTLYAVWRIKTYTVIYNVNGGSGTPANQSKAYGTALTLSSMTPTRTGYTFLGWSTSSSATSAAYQPGGSFTNNADTTLYAVWKKTVVLDSPLIVVGSATAAAGKTVNVPITIKNNPGITSMKLKVTFDPKLTLTGVSYNAEIGGQSQMPQKLTSPVTLNWVNGMTDAEGDWIYATLTFVVADDAQSGTNASVAVTFDPDDVYDVTETNVAFTVQNGQVIIQNHIPGDVTGDGKVNNKDATRLLQYLSDWNVEVMEVALDITGDGKVNNKDATRLLQYLSDWDVEIY